MTKYESDVRTVACAIDEAYAKLSDLSRLSYLKERLDDPAVAEKMNEKLDATQQEQARKMIEGMQFTHDSLTLDTPIGQVALKVVEREEPKLVKLEAENTPLPITIWIQLAPVSETSCKLRVTLGAEVNMFMRAMVSGPLTKAANGLADMLALIA